MAVPSDITYDEKKALVHKFDSLLLLLYTFLLRHTPTHRTHWKAARENWEAVEQHFYPVPTTLEC